MVVAKLGSGGWLSSLCLSLFVTICQKVLFGRNVSKTNRLASIDYDAIRMQEELNELLRDEDVEDLRI